MPPKRLAVSESLTPHAREPVQDGRDKQDDRSGDERRRTGNDGQPLDNGHDQVGGSTRVVGLEAPDELVEFGRRGTDAQEQGDFDEEDDEGEHPASRRQHAHQYSGRSETLQANDAEGDNPISVEDVRDPQREAEDHGEDAGPADVVRLPVSSSSNAQITLIPLPVYACAIVAMSAMRSGRFTCPAQPNSLKFRDLNSSASVMAVCGRA